MKAQFIVTIEGSWLENGKSVTRQSVEKHVRQAIKEEFGYLADRATVRRMPKQDQKREHPHEDSYLTALRLLRQAAYPLSPYCSESSQQWE